VLPSPTLTDAPQEPSFSDRYLLGMLLTICAAPMAILAAIQRYASPPVGDQPHYLVISEALKRYHSVHITNVYANRQYWQFYPGELSPHAAAAPHESLPWHSIGGPVMWLIPYLLLGRSGVMLFMIAVSLLTVANIYWALRDMGISKMYAFVTGLSFGLGSTILTYSSMAFIEPIAALACVYAFRVLHRPRQYTRDLILASTGLGTLPWVHSRFLLLEAPLLALLAWRIFRESRLREWRRYMYALAPAALLGIAFEAYLAVVWHSLNPSINQASDLKRLFAFNPLLNFVGVTLDQEHGVLFYYPIFLFVLPGLLLTLTHKYLGYHLSLLVAAGPYVLTTLSVGLWWGGWAPPARLFATILPLFAFYVGYALQRAHSGIVTGLVGVCVAVSVGWVVINQFTDTKGFSGGSGFMVPLAALEEITHKHLVNRLPNWNPGYHQDWDLFLYWGLVALGFGLAVWLFALRRHRPAPTTTQ